MSFTDAQIAEVRTWVPWTPPSDAEIDDAADTLDGSVYQVARMFLRKRLMTLVASPATISIPGDFSQSTGENMRIIQSMIAELDTLIDQEQAGTDGPLSTGYLCRDDPSRRATAPGGPSVANWPFR